MWSGIDNCPEYTLLTQSAVGTWFAFKYLLRRKALKLERTNLSYGALARLTRDGGFWVSQPSPPPNNPTPTSLSTPNPPRPRH